MADRTQAPFAPLVHADDVEHRRQIAAVANRANTFQLPGTSDSVQRSTRDKLSDTISVKDFTGVTGDGVEDDSSGVQRAFDYCKSNGRTLDLVDGHYLVGELDATGVNIVSSSGAVLEILSGADWLMDVDSAAPIFWSGFALAGIPAVSSIRCSRIENCAHVRMLDIDIYNWADRPLFFEATVGSALVSGGRVYDNTANDVFAYKASHGKFVGITFHDCDEHVIRFGRFMSDPSVRSEHNAVIGCSFEDILNDPILYELDARRGIVSGNTFSRCRRIVKIETTADASTRDFVVSNNVFVTQAGVSGSAVQAGGVDRVNASNNHIDGALQGISVGVQGRVVGNYLRNIDQWAIRYASGSSIVGNTIDVADVGIRTADSDAGRSVVSGNTVQNVDHGIQIQANDNIITGNVIEADTDAIDIVSGASRTLVDVNNWSAGTGGLSDSGTGTVTDTNIT